MGQESSQSRSTPPHWNRVFILTWLAGILAPQVPFQHALKLGPGNFGYNLLIGAAVSILGVVILSSMARLHRRLAENSPGERSVCRVTLAALGIANLTFLLTLFSTIPFPFYWYSLTALGLWPTILLVYVFRSPRRTLQTFQPRILSRPWPFNGIFWALVLLLLSLLVFVISNCIPHPLLIFLVLE